MDLVSLLTLIIAPLFVMALFIVVKFDFQAESKSERGKQIQAKAHSNAIWVFPIGWLLIELYDDFIQEVSLDIYSDYIRVLVLLTFITIGFTIWFLKQKN